MGAMSELYGEIKLLVQNGQLYAAREKLRALGFSADDIPFQLDAVRNLINTQKFIQKQRKPVPVEPLQ